jgi:hypothetical protein
MRRQEESGPNQSRSEWYCVLGAAARTNSLNDSSRLIRTRRDSTIEQVFADPLGRLHLLDLLLATYRRGTVGVRFRPDHPPRTVLVGEGRNPAIGIVVLGDATFKIVRLADVKSVRRVLQNVRQKIDPDVSTFFERTRTFNPPVNSRQDADRKALSYKWLSAI